TLRHLWVVGLIGMHLVIRYAMGPAYWPNIACLLLLVDWGWVIAAVGRLARRTRAESERAPAPSTDGEPDCDAPAAGVPVGRWLERTALATVASTAVFGVFWWPLTSVYMYCGYFSLEKDIRAGIPRLDYYDAAAAQKIACNFRRTQPPPEVAEYFSFQVALRLAGDDRPPRYLYDSLGVPTWKQWVLTVAAPVLIEDLCAKPTGVIEHNPADTDYPAQRFLQQQAEVLRDHLAPDLLANYERLELVYPLADDSGTRVDSLPAEVRKAYAEHDPVLPPKLKMTPIASVPLHGSD
ncbi:MAG: hypothetical protein AAGG46_01130, partial [Planctomycetota bacterium]